MAMTEKTKGKLDEAGKEVKEAIENLKKEVSELSQKVKERLKGTGEEVRETAEDLVEEIKGLSERVKDLVPGGKKRKRSQLPVRVERYMEPRSYLWEHPLVEFRKASDRLFEDFFRGFRWPLSWGESPWGLARETLGTAWPQVDMEETDEAIRITAELPGVDKDNIDISVTDDRLTIRGEKKQEEEKRGKGYYRVERTYGSFQRSFDLPCEVEADRVDATFKNGVLTITLPKSPAALEAFKKIPVRTG